MSLTEILADLDAETAELDHVVAALAPDQWRLPTPARGWTIAHQIAHLSWTDDISLLAIREPDQFTAKLMANLDHADAIVDDGVQEFLAGPAEQLAAWRHGRVELGQALAQVPADRKIPWYGTKMSASSMATARLMETWAHGLDVIEALGLVREPTARLRHIAYLGHRTMRHAFAAHGRDVPTDDVALRLSAPDGALWTFGPAEATHVVSGPALDFCLLATRRRHRDDLNLVATGAVAQEWLDVAQAFAGPPGTGRPPTNQPNTDQPSTDQPSTDQPNTDRP